MSAVRNDNKAVTFLIVACSIGFSAGHCDAGVIATFEEINGGNDLRVSVSGFLNTAALGSSSSTTLNANLARGRAVGHTSLCPPRKQSTAGQLG